MKKLPAKAIFVVMPFFLSIMMSGIISGVATLKALGLTPDFLSLWLKAWGLSWIIAFPTVMLLLPVVRRLTAMVVEAPTKPH